jgi:hypothetical protein
MTEPTLVCPHCAHELTAEEIKRLWASYTASLRQKRGGPQRQERACPSCGMPCESARAAWSHCRIPRGLDAEALLAHVLGRMPKEFGPLGFENHVSIDEGAAGLLEALHDAVGALLTKKMKPREKRQVEWYLGYVDKAMGKLEDVT